MPAGPVSQIQAETRGTVPAGAVEFALHHVSSLLRKAPGPVLFGRVKLTMAADPAVERPAIAQASVDVNGRIIRAQAAGVTMREAVQRACDRLGVRLAKAAQYQRAKRGSRRPAAPAIGRTRTGPPRGRPTLPRRANGR